jgi:hypothetical protein
MVLEFMQGRNPDRYLQNITRLDLPLFGFEALGSQMKCKSDPCALGLKLLPGRLVNF